MRSPVNYGKSDQIEDLAQNVHAFREAAEWNFGDVRGQP